MFTEKSLQHRLVASLDIPPNPMHKVGPKVGPKGSMETLHVVARTLNRLSAMQVGKLKTPGRHSDGGGLYLFIDDKGRRRWIFMYVRAGRRVELGLGSGRDLALAAARVEATALRAMLAEGRNPKAERAKVESVPKFGTFADSYVEAMAPSWRNSKHIAHWRMTLTVYSAAIRDLRVDEIGTNEVLSVLQPLWQRTPETAERLRGRIENVLNAAKAKGYRAGENPATWRGHLDQLLPKRQRLCRGHHAALPFEEAQAFMADLRMRSAMAARALEFTILTAARSGEVLGARWVEMDLDRRVWIVPAERMKAGREHRVPISNRALEILKLVTEDRSGGFVFPGPKGGTMLSSMAMAMLLRRMNVEVTVHGFRSTFRDWASESTNFPHEVCEMALAHAIANKAEAAYRRGDLFDKRRNLMEAWAEFCATTEEYEAIPCQGAMVLIEPQSGATER